MFFQTSTEVKIKQVCQEFFFQFEAIHRRDLSPSLDVSFSFTASASQDTFILELHYEDFSLGERAYFPVTCPFIQMPRHPPSANQSLSSHLEE